LDRRARLAGVPKRSLLVAGYPHQAYLRCMLGSARAVNARIHCVRDERAYYLRHRQEVVALLLVTVVECFQGLQTKSVVDELDYLIASAVIK